MLSFMLTMPLLILSTKFLIVYSVEKHCIMRSVCLLSPIMLDYARLCSIMLDYAPIMLDYAPIMLDYARFLSFYYNRSKLPH